jgi:hypothetical protein
LYRRTSGWLNRDEERMRLAIGGRGSPLEVPGHTKVQRVDAVGLGHRLHSGARIHAE